MRKFIKFVLILGGIFIVLLCGTAAYIKIKYPPEVMRKMATEKLSEALKRKVTVGDAGFNLLTGIEIKDLKISNRPGWAEGNMVVAKDISISYHLYELIMGYFSNQVILGEIKLNEPQILVERRGLGQFNFSDMMGGAVAVPASAPPPAVIKPQAVPAKPKVKSKPKKKRAKHAALPLPVETAAPPSWFADQAWAGTAAGGDRSSLLVSVDSINISHGKMTYLDATTNPPQRSDLKDLNLKVKNISMVGAKTTFSLGAPFVYSGNKYDLAVEGVFRYFKDSQSLKGMDIKGTVNGLGFGFSGDLLNFTENAAPNIDGNASLNMLQFSGLIPKSLVSMPNGLALTGPAKVTFHAGGKLSSGLELAGLADGSELAIKYKDMSVKPAKSICSVDFKSVRYNDGSFDLTSYKLLYQDWEVDGSFNYKNGVSYAGEVHSKSLPLKGLPGMIPTLKNTTVDGACVLDATFSQQLNNPGSIKASGQAVLKGVGITLPQEPYLQDMNGTLYLNNLVVRAPSATFKSFDGSGVMGVTMNFGVQPYPYTFAFNLKNVNGQKTINASMDAFVVKNPQAYKDMLAGNLNMIFQGGGRGFSAAQVESSLAGSGTYSIAQATIKGVSFIKLLNSLHGDKSDALSTDLIEGDLTVKNQVITYNEKSSDKVLNSHAHGAIGFNAMYAPDMKVQLDIKKEYANLDMIKNLIPGLDLSCCYSPDGTVPFDVHLTGSVSKTPGLDAVDMSRIKKNILDCAGKKAQQAIQQKAQEVGQDLGNKLKGLFGR